MKDKSLFLARRAFWLSCAVFTSLALTSNDCIAESSDSMETEVESVIDSKQKKHRIKIKERGLEAQIRMQEKKAKYQEIVEKRKERMDEKEQKLKKREEKIEEKKAAMLEKRCERIEKRVETRLKRYENNKNKDHRIFNKMLERLNKLLTFFNSKELDVSELKDSMAILKGKVEELYSLHDDFIGKLRQTRDYACGESEGSFKNSLGKSRKVLPEIKSQIKDIRSYYRDVVRSEILELRDQLKKKSGDNEEDGEGDGEINED